MATLERAEHDNNRAMTDRRSFGWRTVAYGFLLSRRRVTRRLAEFQSIYSDWHHPWLFFLSVGTMLLSSLDAFLTLQLLDRGFYEANPVMAAIMGHGTMTFAISKLSLTAFGILTLVYLSRHRFMNRFPTGVVLTLIFSFYSCLVCYEFVWLIRDL